MDELLRRLGYDLSTFANVLGRVFKASLVVEGRRVPITLAAGATSASAPHGLGRVYQGAFVETQTAPLDGFYVLPAGADSATLLRVGVATAPVSDVRLSLWVY